MRIGPDGSQTLHDNAFEDDDEEDDDEPGPSLEDPTPRRPALGVLPRSRSSGLSGRSTSSSFSAQTQAGPSRTSPSIGSQQYHGGESGEGEASEASDRFPGPDEVRRARGDSIGSSNASELSRLHRSPHSPRAGSSTRSSRSGSDPPRNLFVPASLGSTSSILSGTTAPTSLGDDQPMTPSMAHSMVVKAEQDLLHFRPSEHGSTLSEQLAAYGASLELGRLRPRARLPAQPGDHSCTGRSVETPWSSSDSATSTGSA